MPPVAAGGAGQRGEVDAAAQVGGHRGAAEGHAGVGRDGGRGRDARDDVEGHGGAADGQHLLDHGVGGVGVAGDEPDDDRAVLGGGDGGLGHLGRLAGRRGSARRRGCASRTASWTAAETSGSTRTSAASASAAVARAVSMPGSPGPAPTKTTRPAVPEVLRKRVIACS